VKRVAQRLLHFVCEWCFISALNITDNTDWWSAAAQKKNRHKNVFA
jgi:hypothetical protein